MSPGLVGVGVKLLLSVANEDPRYVSSLYEWLRSEDELRGLVTLARGNPKPGEMGDLASIVAIAIGSGGILSALASSLGTWMTQHQNRQIVVKMTTKDGRSVEVTGRSRAEIEALLKSAIEGISDAE
jgi:hypothetical protein